MIFHSKEIGSFNYVVSYILNEKQSFKFMVKAEVIPVNLELSKQTMTLKFSDDSQEMETSEYIRVKNTGNADAKYYWFSPSRCLRVEPIEGVVTANDAISVQVIYTPSELKTYEEEMLEMKIEDGEPRQVRVTAFVNETKCEVNPPSVIFGCLCVAQKSSITVAIKNTNPKYSAIWMIDQSTLPKNLDINPKRGKINPDASDRIELTYCSKEENDVTNESFDIKIRGSKKITVPISVKTIVPKVIAYEADYNFGTVTYGNSSSLTMTLENTSPIEAILNLDLRENESIPGSKGHKCIKITQVKSHDDETIVIEEKEMEDILKEMNKEVNIKEGQNLQDNEESFDDQREESGDSFIDRDGDNTNFFQMKLKSNRIYHFDLTFTPWMPKHYKFNMPLA